MEKLNLMKPLVSKLSKRNQNQKVFQIAFVVLLSFSTYISLQPITLPDNPVFWDKLWHALNHFTLLMLFDLSFSKNKRLPQKTVMLFIYGLAIEIAQSYIPLRMFSIKDLAANTFGLGFYHLVRISINHFK